MPSLEEIANAGAASAEKCVRDSMAMDYAWMKDLRSIRSGQTPKELDAWIDRRLEELKANGSGAG
jgi:hypothetical protein